MTGWKTLAMTVAGLGLAAPALASAEAGGAAIPFDSDIGNFVFTLIIFGLVVLTLGKYAWKPLLKVLQEREATIRTAIESANSNQAAAERLLTEYKAQLDRAAQEAAALLDKGRHDADAARQRMLEDARHEATEIAARARREIELASDAALKELYDRAAELSIDVARRIVSKELSADDHRRLIEDSLAEMRDAGKTGMN